MNELYYVWQGMTSPTVLMAAIAGVLWGMCGGALPGISTAIAMSLVLPFTYGMDPSAALVLLGAIYIGSEYGGSIPAILIRTPASGSSAAAVIDGYAMHRQGRGGEALGLSLVGGTIGGLIGLLLLTLSAQQLSKVALFFTPPAYFALGILGISVIASLSSGQVVKGLIAGVLGLMLATVGTDPVSGVTRYTFGYAELLGGIPVIVVMMGMFAISELMIQARERDWPEQVTERSTRLKLPSLRKLWQLRVPQFIAVVLGLIEGLTPGGGGSIAAFMSYNEAKRWSKEPEKFGKGSEEGVIAPETANNVVALTALIPTLSFGIPGTSTAAILLAALLIHGLHPGPMLFSSHPDVVYRLFGGLFVANIGMFVFGLIILSPIIWLVNRPRAFLRAGIFALIFSGIYSVDGSEFDLYLVLAIGVVGYLLRALDFPFLPFVLAVVLGYMIEANYRRSLLISNGDHLVFLQNPISACLLALAAIFVLAPLYRQLRTGRRPAADPATTPPLKG
ncbi:tripartite tricarboxylate transporter permease [Starkeya sp. ORNL1]|uniref:tripartite tricarboxylate transporter permease n=1 Tax=Starkeya sp. ORNL1 TaxID=2709380 RepID=UPI001FEDB4CD|nr:tripartite tricarboxylate transporter permease [Starkeya sp. ORNL1]